MTWRQWIVAIAALIIAGLCALAARRHLAKRDAEKRRAQQALDNAVGDAAHRTLSIDHAKHIERANQHAMNASIAGEAARKNIAELEKIGAGKMAELAKRWNR